MTPFGAWVLLGCLSLAVAGCSDSSGGGTNIDASASAGGTGAGVAGAVTIAGAGTGAVIAGANAGGASAGASGVAGGGDSSGGANAVGGIGGASGGAAGSGGVAPGGGTGGSVNVDHSLPGKIVVLGSSTAAGTGPKDPKNAWVERYRTYLADQFPRFNLVNLAVGGYTTYQIQPTGFVPPAGRPGPVDGHNITTALAQNPGAIIVNMPSNDSAASYSMTDQLANFDRVVGLAKAAHVLIWVTTTQPRTFSQPPQFMTQTQVRDAILQQYAPRTLDFWNPFAADDGTIKPEYNSGDNTHMNDAGHAILEMKVVAAQIPEAMLSGAQ